MRSRQLSFVAGNFPHQYDLNTLTLCRIIGKTFTFSIQIDQFVHCKPN